MLYKLLLDVRVSIRQEYENNAVEQREELQKSHDEVARLNGVVADCNSQLDKLNAHIDWLKQAAQVSPTALITFSFRHPCKAYDLEFILTDKAKMQ